MDIKPDSVSEALADALSAYETLIDAQAGAVRLAVVELCERHRLRFLSGNGAFTFHPLTGSEFAGDDPDEWLSYDGSRDYATESAPIGFGAVLDLLYVIVPIYDDWIGLWVESFEPG